MDEQLNSSLTHYAPCQIPVCVLHANLVRTIYSLFDTFSDLFSCKRSKNALMFIYVILLKRKIFIPHSFNTTRTHGDKLKVISYERISSGVAVSKCIVFHYTKPQSVQSRCSTTDPHTGHKTCDGRQLIFNALLTLDVCT